MAMITVKGDKALIKTLATVGHDVHLAGRNALRRGVAELAQKARDYAPVEYGNLESAIRVEEEHLGTNKWSETVYVDMDTPATERGSDVTVGKYALHAEYNTRGGIGTGKGSMAKAASLGVRVGPRYMGRAYREMVPKIRADVAQAIADALARKTMREAVAGAATKRAEAYKAAQAKRRATALKQRPITGKGRR